MIFTHYKVTKIATGEVFDVTSGDMVFGEGKVDVVLNLQEGGVEDVTFANDNGTLTNEAYTIEEVPDVVDEAGNVVDTNNEVTA